MTDDTAPVLHCANHPDRETLLRCNRCEKPICIQCAVRTPTGYRCKECISGLQKVFETALWYDYVIAVLLAGFLSFAASMVTSVMGFFTLIIAPLAGVIIAEIVRWATRRRRSSLLFKLAGGAAALGGAPLFVLGLIRVLFYLGGSSGWAISLILPLVWNGLYIFLVASSVYYRLKGIQLK